MSLPKVLELPHEPRELELVDVRPVVIPTRPRWDWKVAAVSLAMAVLTLGAWLMLVL